MLRRLFRRALRRLKAEPDKWLAVTAMASIYALAAIALLKEGAP